MPDFEVNEGYVEAGHNRADPPLGDSARDGDPSFLSREEEQLLDDWLWSWYGLPPPSDPALQVRAREDEPPSEPRHLPEETPIVHRVRDDAEGHLSEDRHSRNRRTEVRQMAQRRFKARRACPFGWRVRVLDRPTRKRRRLWTACHGQRPSPPGPR